MIRSYQMLEEFLGGSIVLMLCSRVYILEFWVSSAPNFDRQIERR